MIGTHQTKNITQTSGVNFEARKIPNYWGAACAGCCTATKVGLGQYKRARNDVAFHIMKNSIPPAVLEFGASVECTTTDQNWHFVNLRGTAKIVTSEEQT